MYRLRAHRPEYGKLKNELLRLRCRSDIAGSKQAYLNKVTELVLKLSCCMFVKPTGITGQETLGIYDEHLQLTGVHLPKSRDEALKDLLENVRILQFYTTSAGKDFLERHNLSYE